MTFIVESHDMFVCLSNLRTTVYILNKVPINELADAKDAREARSRRVRIAQENAKAKWLASIDAEVIARETHLTSMRQDHANTHISIRLARADLEDIKMLRSKVESHARFGVLANDTPGTHNPMPRIRQFFVNKSLAGKRIVWEEYFSKDTIASLWHFAAHVIELNATLTQDDYHSLQQENLSITRINLLITRRKNQMKSQR